MSDKEPTLKTLTRNVNNKRLFKEIDDFMIEVFTTLKITWSNKQHRKEFVELIDDWMDQFAYESGKIIQYDVICDGRNNTPEELKKHRLHFLLRYRQTNCLNTTEIEYIIKT